MNVGLSVANTGEYIKMLHMDSETDNVIAFEFEYSLKEFKRRTHADVIEIGTVSIEGMPFKTVYSRSVNNGIHITASDGDGKTVYRGSLLILGFDIIRGREMLRDLTNEEIMQILKNLALMTIRDDGGNEPYNSYVLCNVSVSGN